jgi:hypothetical protein
MPSLNAAARNSMATAAGTLCGSGTLQILEGSTVLASHTMAGFGSPAMGVITANAIASSTISATGIANGAKIINGSQEVTLSLGTSGAEVIVSSTSYVAGGTSTVNSVTITYPAS